MCVLYHNFYCIFPVISLRHTLVLDSCSYTDMGCLVIEVSSFKTPNAVGVFPWHYKRNRSTSRKVVSCSFTTLNDGKVKKKNLSVILHRQNPLNLLMARKLQAQSLVYFSALKMKVTHSSDMSVLLPNCTALHPSR
jgi:hypothetical protein